MSKKRNLSVVRKKCSKCGVEQMTWPEVSNCNLCGGSLRMVTEERGKRI